MVQMFNTAPTLILISSLLLTVPVFSQTIEIEQYNFFEVRLKGPSNGNPFTDVSLEAVFKNGKVEQKIKGFYDGNGQFLIRFMPFKTGKWEYTTYSNSRALEMKRGFFICTDASAGNHGPIGIADSIAFAYKDGKYFYPLGTTAYSGFQQVDTLVDQSIKTLASSPFNKIRATLLPMWPGGDFQNLYPFEGNPHNWNFTRFNPEYFRRIEKRILQMQELGIEVDLIVFHPYDSEWGFNEMNWDEQELYMQYVISRLSSFRNIWWSVANEYDLMPNRKIEDWDYYIRYFALKDPYQHLLSIHNSSEVWFDYSNSYITHLSIQSESWWDAPKWKKQYNKPVIFDEMCYEGDKTDRTIGLTGDALTHRFWMLTVAGCYGTHGEAFYQAYGDQFFKRGGSFAGRSPGQLKLLEKVLNESPAPLQAMWNNWKTKYIMAGVPGEYYIYYLGDYQLTGWYFTEIPGNIAFKAEIMNTSDGTVTEWPVLIKKGDSIKLPGKPFIAIRLVSDKQVPK